ncbi:MULTISPECIES: type II secretion system protein [Shewanella]|uniref:type II secretion system protein n=1 Tax=Shewanella TaxID=22 RepID=UPI0021D94680|nr:MULTISPECIES: type II secretion system protein [unclassified Shewanella]MCU8021410.1 type II secretion system protein [Shewanella sp. SM78]MCU8043426.1 type II secretion system protein [Shewanella sp. SM68]MCU8048688.1 type II secretion system protein [Shewanella sp. SM65]MCU8078560.1 type II secretion system protein [Shewanella sp. SM103]
MKKQNGFTLIELVVVIIILGILAVTAAPKFINLQGDARASTIQGMKGAIQGANSLVYSKAALLGIEGADTGSVDVLGNTVAGTPATATDDVPVVYGYMAATKAALEKGMDVKFNTGTSPSSAVPSGEDAADWVINASGNSATIWQRGAPADVTTTGSEASCKIVYTAAASAGALPTITLTDNGC